MSGISEALVATAIGLLVAIPAVVAFNIFQGRVRRAMAEIDAIAHLVLSTIPAGAPPAAQAEGRHRVARANNFGSGDDDPGPMIVNINVTPLVDITLVLLIIFMVTASYIVSPAIRVDLPKAASGTRAAADRAGADPDQGRRPLPERRAEQTTRRSSASSAASCREIRTSRP